MEKKKLRLPLPEKKQRQDSQHSLVGKFIDELPHGLPATDEAVTRLWHPSGWMRTIPFPDGFVFQFALPEDRSRVMAGGPYSVDGKLLVLQPLPPGTTSFLLLDNNNIQFNRVPVWITLSGLPIDLYCPEVALAAAEPAGKPIEADVVLGSVASGPGRVRVRVEIETEEPLLQGTYLDPRDGNGSLLWVGFEYEAVPRICRNCRCIGHSERSCKKTAIQAKLLIAKRLQRIGDKINAERGRKFGLFWVLGDDVGPLNLSLFKPTG